MDEFEPTNASLVNGDTAGSRTRRPGDRNAEGQSAEEVFETLTQTSRADDADLDTSDPFAFADPLDVSDDADAVEPEHKYSFNALIAVGIAGFFVGRLLSR